MEILRLPSNPALERFDASPLGKAYHGTITLCDWCGGIILAVFTVFVTVNVLGRFLFNTTYGATEELCTMLLLWMVSLGSVGPLERYTLFYAEVLLMYFPSLRFQRWLFAFNSLVTIATFGLMAVAASLWVWQTRGFELDYIYINAFWFYGALPIWGVLMTVVAIKKLIFMQIPDLSEFEAED